MSTWISKDNYQETFGLECSITIEPRPYWCDRGKFIAKIHPRGELALEMDDQDGWPRYYFSEACAKREIKAWLTRRGQLPK